MNTQQIEEPSHPLMIRLRISFMYITEKRPDDRWQILQDVKLYFPEYSNDWLSLSQHSSFYITDKHIQGHPNTISEPPAYHQV